MKVKMLSLFSIMDAHDDTNLDAGSLMRYLAELVWLPTALLPSENLRWTPIDDHRALATLTDSGTTVSLEFSFKPETERSAAFSRPLALTRARVKPNSFRGLAAFGIIKSETG